MQIIGIIAEFNPFHNGHLHLINEARKKVNSLTGDETAVIVCMSGNYVQRGSLAIFDKYSRAESALCGADLVFEMPVIPASSDAGTFARCGVEILSRLGADHIAFGIEDSVSDISSTSEELTMLADILRDEPAEYKGILSENLSRGESYPAARINALKSYTDSDCSVISTPNNILALEYLIAIGNCGRDIKPVFIPRIGSGYNDNELRESYSSATAIRNLIITGSGEAAPLDRGMQASNEKDVSDYITSNIPEFSYKCIAPYLSHPAVSDRDILPYIISAIKTESRDSLKQIYGMNDELLNRLNKLILPIDYDAIKDHMKTRNVTMTRICRLLLHTALGIKFSPDTKYKPAYTNLLAMKRSSSKLLGHICESSDLTVINKKAAYKPDDSLSELSWSTDIRTTDIYNQIVFEKTGMVLSNELSSNIRIL